MKLCLNLTFFFALSFLLSGCTSYEVKVSSYRNRDLDSGKIFVIIPDPALKNITEEDLEFKQFSGFVCKVLESKGYVHGSSLDDSDILIYLFYEVSAPKERTVDVSIPITGQTGYSSARTVNGVTTFQPQYGTIGYRNQRITRVFRGKGIAIRAYDISESKRKQAEVESWRTLITIVDESSDLRAYFPIMLTAASDVIGIDTQKEITKRIYQNDKRLKWLTSQYP